MRLNPPGSSSLTRTVAAQVSAFGSRQSTSGESRPRRFSERAAADIEFIDDNGGGPGVRRQSRSGKSRPRRFFAKRTQTFAAEIGTPLSGASRRPVHGQEWRRTRRSAYGEKNAERLVQRNGCRDRS